MTNIEILAELERGLKNAKILNSNCVPVSVEVVEAIKSDIKSKNAKKPNFEKEIGHLCGECQTNVNLGENYCSNCGIKIDWEAEFENCF